MQDDERVGVVGDGAEKYFARMDQRGVEDADRNDLFLENMMFGIKIDSDEMFFCFVLEFFIISLRDICCFGDLFLGFALLGKPSVEFEDGNYLAGFGRADAVFLCELVDVYCRES